VFLVELEREDEEGLLRTIHVDTPSVREGPAGRFFRATRGTSPSGGHVRSWSARHPFQSDWGRSMQRVGWVLREDYAARITNVCHDIAPRAPAQKQDYGQQPLYPGEWPSRCPCHDWTFRAVQALLGAGVLEPLRPSDNGQLVCRAYG
jgi:hypothetical protein